VASLLLYFLLAVAAVAALLIVFPLRPATRGSAMLALSLALAGAAGVLFWPAPLSRGATGKRLIDASLPSYEFHERHRTRICAPSGKIAEAIREVPSNEIRWLWLLSSLRGLKAAAANGDKPVLTMALESNFVSLADTPAELLIGTGGEFWRLGGAPKPEKLMSVKHDPAAFAALDLAGLPKAVMNFTIDPAPFGCKAVSTETRIHTAHPQLAGRFARYWRVIQPGSALLRRSWLDAIRRRAEAGQ
jgi:hypothetical protein